MTSECRPASSRSPGAGASEAHRESVPRQRFDEYDHLEAILAQFVSEPADSALRTVLRERLAAGYAPLARNLATRYQGRREPLEDLIQIAMIGLLNALSRFDPSLRTPFVAFAIPTITGELRHHLRDRTWATRVPRPLKELQPRLARTQEELARQLGRAPRVSELAAALDVDRETVIDALQAMESATTDSLDRAIRDDATGTLGGVLGAPDDGYRAVDTRQSLASALRLLSDRERSIVTLRFFEGRTQTEIANHLGVSQMHVSRLLAATLAKLRHNLDNTDGDIGPPD